MDGASVKNGTLTVSTITFSKKKVHALSKQAEVTKSLLSNILQKIQQVSKHLPPTADEQDYGTEPQSLSSSTSWPFLDPVAYPTLHHFLHKDPASSNQPPEPSNFKQPSGLALLGGQGQGGQGHGQNLTVGSPHHPSSHPPLTVTARSRSPGLVSLAPTFSIPKASPSMALASNALDATLSTFSTTGTLASSYPSSSSSSPLHKVGRDHTSLESLASHTSNSSVGTKRSQTTLGHLWPPQNQNTIAIASPQPTTPNAPRASDNLRRLANQAGSHPHHPHY